MRKTVVCLCVLVLCALLMASCAVDDIDISNFEDDQILLVGLTDDEEKISVKELKELKCTTKKTESTSDKIGTVRATGPLLTTLATSLGADLNDYSKVIIYGEDNYDIRLNKDFLKENQIILAFGIDGEPLEEDAHPVRIIIPESDSAYWVRMVNKIEFVK